MLFSMCFEPIDPTIAYAIAELFFLPVQNMLQGTKNRTDMLVLTHNYWQISTNYMTFDLWKIRLLLIIKRLPKNPLLDPSLIMFNLKWTKQVTVKPQYNTVTMRYLLVAIEKCCYREHIKDLFHKNHSCHSKMLAIQV